MSLIPTYGWGAEPSGGGGDIHQVDLFGDIGLIPALGGPPLFLQTFSADVVVEASWTRRLRLNLWGMVTTDGELNRGLAYTMSGTVAAIGVLTDALVYPQALSGTVRTIGSLVDLMKGPAATIQNGLAVWWRRRRR